MLSDPLIFVVALPADPHAQPGPQDVRSPVFPRARAVMQCLEQCSRQGLIQIARPAEHFWVASATRDRLVACFDACYRDGRFLRRPPRAARPLKRWIERCDPETRYQIRIHFDAPPEAEGSMSGGETPFHPERRSTGHGGRGGRGGFVYAVPRRGRMGHRRSFG